MLSYVHRQRALSAKRQDAFTKLWGTYGLSLDEDMLNFERYFDNANPVSLEIGFGMGEGFFANVVEHPEQNFIGIEVHRPGIGALLAKLVEQPQGHVRIFAENAVSVFTQCIPNQSLERVLIFFPDPWPKRRHHKRRLIQAEFCKLVYHKLKLGGYLHVATDDASYAQQVIRVVSQVEGLAQVTMAGDGGLDLSQEIWPRPISKFAMRCHQHGQKEKISDLIFIKK